MTSRPGARLKAVLRASATFTCPRVLDQTAHADGRARADAASGRPERSRNNFLEPGNEGHASNILHHFLLLSALLSSPLLTSPADPAVSSNIHLSTRPSKLKLPLLYT